MCVCVESLVWLVNFVDVEINAYTKCLLVVFTSGSIICVGVVGAERVS